eukprot:NODE_911_length_1831_cov_27.327160_g803_i0.p1 GENE.NODE_911_length_1831_cov_27.327160_g803_i0~~NODE_911_length_1831_cov_27.327160_g803_i0.p1  ORF type:complete len:291 (+),score=46.09 NODE_911_length_1831_cov_27.327160_g803_i0:112-984(+)
MDKMAAGLRCFNVLLFLAIVVSLLWYLGPRVLPATSFDKTDATSNGRSSRPVARAVRKHHEKRVKLRTGRLLQAPRAPRRHMGVSPSKGATAGRRLVIVALETRDQPLYIESVPHAGSLPGDLFQLGKGFTGVYNHGLKVELFHSWLQNQTDPEQLVIFIDGGDVMWGGCDTDFQAEYERFRKERKRDVVFGTELGCWPDPRSQNQYPPVPESSIAKVPLIRPGSFAEFVECDWTCSNPPASRFLNSGFMMGTVSALKEMVAAVVHDLRSTGGRDDQAGTITDYYDYGKH